MTTTQTHYDRITFSLPNSLNIALDELKSELKSSKSEIIKMAIESYIDQENKKKIQRAVALMAKEYEDSDELTVLTALDSEEFQ